MREEKQLKLTEREVQSLFILIVILSVTAITLMGVTIYLYFRAKDYKHEITKLYATLPQKPPGGVNDLSAIPLTGVGEEGLKPLPPFPVEETNIASSSTPSTAMASAETPSTVISRVTESTISSKPTPISATPVELHKEVVTKVSTTLHKEGVKPRHVVKKKVPLKVFTKEEVYRTASLSYKLHTPIYRISGTYTLDKIGEVTPDLSSYLVYPISEGVYRLYYIGDKAPPVNSKRLLYVYSIQLISSTKRKGIFEIARRLRDRGFPVFVYDYYSGNSGKTELYGIELGVFENLRDAQELSTHLTNDVLSILRKEVGNSVNNRYPKMIR